MMARLRPVEVTSTKPRSCDCPWFHKPITELLDRLIPDRAEGSLVALSLTLALLLDQLLARLSVKAKDIREVVETAIISTAK
jgi:hypothetical protein